MAAVVNFSNFAGGTHFSGRIDFRQLQSYIDQFGEEARMAIAGLLTDGQHYAMGHMHLTLKRMNIGYEPVQFNVHDKHSRGTGRASSFSQQHRVGSGLTVFDRIADSIRTSREIKDEEVRVGVFSDPYPIGAVGKRKGKIARMHEQGVGPFMTTWGWTHRGFEALHIFKDGGRMLEEYVSENLDKTLHRLRPGGEGA
jgi:hypothetical protein